MLDKAFANLSPTLSTKVAAKYIGQALRCNVSLRTFSRWRRELGLVEVEGLSPTYLLIVAYFGRLRRNRVSVDVAIQSTHAFIKENQL